MGSPSNERPSPFLGLSPYGESDADVFFGRRAERDLVVANLLTSRLTVLYGPSGVGKSSLLRAGVVPRLRANEGVPTGGSLRTIVLVDSWHDDPGFVAFLADRIRGTGAHVVFTAHSLPARILDEGDPYRDQLLDTSRLVAGAAEISDWSFSFQSESPTGEPWLGPDILDHLTELAGSGTTDVLVCPVGFVSDHLEIRWDIDTEARERAAELGLRLERIEMPNADPRFVDVLAEIVRGALAPVAASR